MSGRYASLAALCWLLILGLFPGLAQAHRFAPVLLQVSELDAGQFQLVWKVPLQASSPVPMQPEWPEGCEPQGAGAPQIEGTGRVVSWRLDCTALGEVGLVGSSLGIAGLGANQTSAMLLVSLRDGREYQQVLTPEQPRFVLPAEPGAGQVMTDYSWLGVEHIWTGLDHLLFVFGLLLLVRNFRALLLTITAFTIGHSITLSLVTLGVIGYPVGLVEFSIALSIFWLAVVLTLPDRGGVFHRHPWWLAGGFGLLHGMGFAGALVATGLPQANLPLALLFFNIGIEAGQLAFIVAVGLFWMLLRRPLGEAWQARLRPLPVYLLGILSASWCIERGLEMLAG